MTARNLTLPSDDQNVDVLVTSLMNAFGEVQLPVLAEEAGKPGAEKGRPSARPVAGKPRRKRRGGNIDPDVIVHAGKTFIIEMKEGGVLFSSPVVEEKFRGAMERAVREVLIEKANYVWHIEPTARIIAEVVQRSLPNSRRKVSEATIEKMVDALVETHDPLASINAEIDAANAKARMRFMANFLTYSAEEVTEYAESAAKNRHQTASRWKKDGKVFSILYQHRDRFPAFQFKDGRPLPVIADVLGALPKGMSSWEIAFWFVSTNGWLGGEAPIKCLREPERVVEAARLEADAVVG